MKVPDKGMLLDSLKGSIATLTLFLAYISLPLAGILAGLFAPLPVMHYVLKSGRAVGVAIVLVTVAFLAILANPTIPLLYLIQGGLISLTLPHFLLKGWGGTRSIVSSAAVSFACLLLLVTLAWQINGLDVHAVVQKGINSSISQTIDLYEKGGLKEDQLLTLRQGMRQVGDVVGRIYPAITLVALGVIAGLNLQVLRRVAERLKSPLALAGLSSFRNPDHLIWFVIIPGFALLVNNADVATAALNVLVVTLTLYFMQGLAVALSMFDRYMMPRFIRVAFYILLALQPYLAAALAALGIFDLWGNFRTPKQNKNL
jgi:uncharacterized protein YybS (DUF2232 family)